MTTFEVEVVLLDWGASARTGHWIKLALPVPLTDGHPFALFERGAEHGQRFHMTFTAIGNDEKPMVNPDGGSTGNVSSQSNPPPAQARGAAEPATPRKRGRLEIEAYEMCRSAEFSEWCRFSSPRKRWNNEHVIASRMPNKEWIETFPASYVKWYCGVNHRHEIDTDPEAAARWRELMRMFQERSR